MNATTWMRHDIDTEPEQLSILGAVCGLDDVTQKARQLIKDNSLIIPSDFSTLFGDNWPNVYKAFTIVYSYGYVPSIAVKGEHTGDLVIALLSRKNITKLSKEEEDRFVTAIEKTMESKKGPGTSEYFRLAVECYIH